MKHILISLCLAVAILPFAGNSFGLDLIQDIDSLSFRTNDAVYEAGPDMPASRLWHHAVVLPDGKAALIGGITRNFVSLSTVEVYDPAENTFTTLTMNHIHASPAITKLLDGSYLIAGGSANLGVPRHAEAEIFDPANLTFTQVGNMNRFRASAGAAALADSSVVIAGAWWTHNTAHTYGEWYDPGSKTFTEIGPFSISRSHAIVIPTSDGKAMILGGVRPNGTREKLPVELFNPSNGDITTLQSSLLADDEAWTVSNAESVTDNQRLADGTYLWMAMKAGSPSHRFNIVLIDPETKEIEVMETEPGLPDSGSYYFIGQPVIDNRNNRAYLLAVVAGTDSYQIAVFTVDLVTGSLTKSSNYHTMTDYQLRSAPAVLLEDGRIFVSGGSVSNNFDAVSHTLFITPPEPATPSAAPTSELPQKISLHQNYPNPFNPSTIIGFELAEAGEILLEVFDMTGRRVAVLVDGYRSPGHYSLQFDAGGLASGMYTSRLTTGNQVLTRKMTLIR